MRMIDGDFPGAHVVLFQRHRVTRVAPRPAPTVPTLRWARAVERVVVALEDVPSVVLWAEHAAMSPRALWRLCEVTRTPAKASLNLGRLARTVIHSEPTAWRPELLLDADPRTVHRLLAGAGVLHRYGHPPPTVAELLASARWPLPAAARSALAAVLARLPDAG